MECRSHTRAVAAGPAAPSGRIANVGVHGAPARLHLETLWGRHVDITTRIVDCSTAPMLMQQARRAAQGRTLAAGRAPLEGPCPASPKPERRVLL